MRALPRMIVSGGQTGVDRAALDVAIAVGMPHGGWCPAGRRAEGGPIPARYHLRETRAAAYHVRTDRNVRDSDGTLILVRGAPRGGTALTCRSAMRREKPLLVVHLASQPDAAAVRRWIALHAIATLNVAGPRASCDPEVYALAKSFLRRVLGKRNAATPTAR